MSGELKKLYIAWAYGGKFKKSTMRTTNIYRIDYCIPILGMHGVSSVWIRANE